MTLDLKNIYAYAKAMHRTMIHIDNEEYLFLTKQARRMGKSFAALVREAIGYYIDKVAKKPLWDKDPLWKLAGLKQADRHNSDSRDHDQILYGDSK